MITPWAEPRWPPAPNYLPCKQPGTTRSFVSIVCPPSVVPVYTSVAAAPSGAGELQLSYLSVRRNAATFIAAGGVAGRVYTLAFFASDALENVYQTLAFLPIDDVLATDPPPLAPSAGFGPSLTWGNSVTQYTPVAPISGSLVLANGGAGQPLVTSVVNGGVIYNPSVSTYQGIGVAESIWVDMTGQPAQVGGGSTSLEVPPGESLPLIPSVVGVSWTAATTGHKINAVVY